MAPQQWLLSYIFHHTLFDIVDLLLCEVEDIIFDGIRMRRQLAYGHFLCHILSMLFPRHRLQPVTSLPEIYSYYRPPRATDRRLGQRALQAAHQQMGLEAAAEAAEEDEALAGHEATGLHNLDELSSEDSDDETYAPHPPRAHNAEAGGSQQVPPPSSAEASSIAVLTRLIEEQQRQAQLDREELRAQQRQSQQHHEETREIVREMRRQQQAQAAAQQQMNMMMMSMIQQLA